MTWFKVDDKFSMHPKAMDAGNAALGLWVRAGSWCAAHLTDGFIPANLLSAMGGNRATAEKLVKVRLWEIEPGGYRFRDWHVYQPSAADVKAAEEAERTGGSWGNHIRWHVKKKISNPDCRFCTGEAANES